MLLRMRVIWAVVSSLLIGAAHASCPTAYQPSFTPDGCEWKKSADKNGCDTFSVECQSDAQIDQGCLLPSLPGPCTSHITKFFFDPRVGKCMPFVFSGCNGNANNFASRDECIGVCLNHQPRPVPEQVVQLVDDTPTINCTGDNEIVFKCGACDSECNKPSIVCPLSCRTPQCGCAEGFVRNTADKRCVKPEQCSGTDNTCDTIRCRAGTECVDGKCVAVKEQDACAAVLCVSSSTCVNGTCVPQKGTAPNASCPVFKLAAAPENCGYKYVPNKNGCDTPKLTCKGVKCADNEEVKICGACDDTCTDKCPLTETCKKPACGCVSGFVRSSAGTCIPAKSCPDPALVDPVPSKDEVKPTTKKCGAGETSNPCGTACEPTCAEPAPSICTMQCIVDACECKDGFLREKKGGKCVPEGLCPALVQKPTKKKCGVNEHLTKCGTKCEPTCDEPLPSFCTEECVVNACQCSPGFVRDSDDNCVLLSDCPNDKVF